MMPYYHFAYLDECKGTNNKIKLVDDIISTKEYIEYRYNKYGINYVLEIYENASHNHHTGVACLFFHKFSIIIKEQLSSNNEKK